MTALTRRKNQNRSKKKRSRNSKLPANAGMSVRLVAAWVDLYRRMPGWLKTLVWLVFVALAVVAYIRRAAVGHALLTLSCPMIFLLVIWMFISLLRDESRGKGGSRERRRDGIIEASTRDNQRMLDDDTRHASGPPGAI